MKKLLLVGSLILIIIITAILACSDDNNFNTARQSAVNNNVQQNMATYQVDPGEIFNPERGFYKHYETKASNYSILSQSSLNAVRTSKKSLILRLYYLDSFLNTNIISPTFLTNMQTDFDRCRVAGIKCIVRFAYTDTYTPGSNNPTKARIKLHIDQLAPVLEANKDVIASFQAGFIGTWGEWYYTDNFGITNLTSQNIADRNEILSYLLDKFPDELQIAVRTPLFKMNMFGSTNMTLTEANIVSNKSRIGFHNDAVLNGADDEGTFSSNNLVAEQTYLGNETMYTIMGGESNALDTQYQECSNAKNKLAKYHYTYLNDGYHPDVLAYWNTNGCLATFKNKLGYRFEMVKSSISASKILSLTVKNTGYGNLINKHDIYIVAKNNSTGVITNIPLTSVDARRWMAGAGNITITDDLNTHGLASGSYTLYIKIVDKLIPNNIKYNIRFANLGTWDESTGYNKLNRTITIQ